MSNGNDNGGGGLGEVFGAVADAIDRFSQSAGNVATARERFRDAPASTSQQPVQAMPANPTPTAPAIPGGGAAPVLETLAANSGLILLGSVVLLAVALILKRRG